MNLSRHNPFVAVDLAQPAFDAVKHLATGVHRVAIVHHGDPDKGIYGLLTQSSVVTWASNHMKSFADLGRRTVESLGLARGRVITAPSTTSAGDALQVRKLFPETRTAPWYSQAVFCTRGAHAGDV